MRYIISDIHGCYEEYQALLEKIGFSFDDELYVLGDAMDRGPAPVRVMQDLMNRPNVFYILGNHDHMMMRVMAELAVEVTGESLQAFTGDALLLYRQWLRNGGGVTAKQFHRLSRPEQRDMLEYLAEADPFELLEEGDRLFILVHAGIDNFRPDKELYDYDPIDFLWHRTNYSLRYYPSERVFLVTGHTPTPLIRADKQPLVYRGNGHVAIDCGCVFGGALAAYCVETGQVSYVPRRADTP